MNTLRFGRDVLLQRCLFFKHGQLGTELTHLALQGLEATVMAEKSMYEHMKPSAARRCCYLRPQMKRNP